MRNTVFMALGIIMLSCVQEVNPHDKVPSRLLMHDVYLNLVNSISDEDEKMVFNEIKRLEQVKTTRWVHVGRRAETGDARLDADFDIALHVVFDNEEDMKAYAEDALHLEVRSNVKEFLAGPPIVFDYWTE